MASLISGDWIRARHNLHLTGPTGTGKSWLACALGHQACRQGLSVRYERVPRLLDTLRIARGDGSYHKRLLALAKADLLILDDWSQTFNSGRAPRSSGADTIGMAAIPPSLPANCPLLIGMLTWVKTQPWPTPCWTAS